MHFARSQSHLHPPSHRLIPSKLFTYSYDVHMLMVSGNLVGVVMDVSYSDVTFFSFYHIIMPPVRGTLMTNICYPCFSLAWGLARMLHILFRLAS